MRHYLSFQKLKITPFFLMLTVSFFLLSFQSAQGSKKKTKTQKADSSKLKSSTFSGLKWRSIGPAFTSGRIADFAVNPAHTSAWYVATAS